MAVAINRLPQIVDTLSVNGRPEFFVLHYDEFVRFVIVASGGLALDVVSILDCDGKHVFAILRGDHYATYIPMLDVFGEVDEAHYLDKHRDVKAAVSRGELRNGTQHYLIQGYFERREVRFPAESQVCSGGIRAMFISNVPR